MQIPDASHSNVSPTGARLLQRTLGGRAFDSSAQHQLKVARKSGILFEKVVLFVKLAAEKDADDGAGDDGA